MMRFAGIVSAIALLFGSATIGAGQETPGETVASALTEGTRVRVLWTTVRTRVSGIVVAADETTITLAPDGGLPHLPQFPRRAVRSPTGQARDRRML
jgi:hypothetical protein